MDKHRPDLFMHLVNNLRYGAASEELSDAIAEAVKSSQDTGKAATLTLTIKIKPKRTSGQYFIEDDIKLKLPELMREETIMFGTPDGNLVRDDPRQHKLPLRDATPQAETQVKNVDQPALAVKAV